MDNLSKREKKVIGYSTKQIDDKVDLAKILENIIENASPVDILVAEGQGPSNPSFGYGDFIISEAVNDSNWDVRHGDQLILHTLSEIGVEVYEFVTDIEGTVSDPSYIPINIRHLLTAASCDITITSTPLESDTISVGSVTYTFKTVPEGETDVKLGNTLSETLSYLHEALNTHPLISATPFDQDGKSTLSAVYAGYIDEITVGSTISGNEFPTSLSNGGPAAAGTIDKLYEAIDTANQYPSPRGVVFVGNYDQTDQIVSGITAVRTVAESGSSIGTNVPSTRTKWPFAKPGYALSNKSVRLYDGGQGDVCYKPTIAMGRDKLFICVAPVPDGTPIPISITDVIDNDDELRYKVELRESGALSVNMWRNIPYEISESGPLPEPIEPS